MRFEELKLPVGKRFKLTLVGLDYKRHECEAQLVGYGEQKVVFAGLPNKPAQVLLHEGLKAEARIPLMDGVASFETTLEKIVEFPFLYVQLDYPGRIHKETLRQSARIKVDKAVEVNAHTGLGMTASAILGHMLDVSVAGARLVLEKELTAMVTKTSLAVQLSIPGLQRNMQVMAVIKNTSQTSADYPECGFAYGVEFIELEAIDRYFLQAFCTQQTLKERYLLCE